MNTLYLECYSGISGDMTVGALLDLGVDQDALLNALSSLKLDGYHISISRVKKNGIDATDFQVELTDPETIPHEHTHVENGHTVTHIHAHEHHGHGHGERGLPEILPMIERSNLTVRAKKIASDIFTVLAQAEASVHGTDLEHVHFHEVGAVDSIIDIVSAAFCVDYLKIERVICSTLHEGTGTVKCRHGLMPVPAPATLKLIETAGIPLQITQNVGEMVTPTGAAIVAALADSFELPKEFSIIKSGAGAGKKDFPQANILRAMLLREKSKEKKDEIFVLQTCIDDSTPEQLAYCQKLLLEQGALDVYFVPAMMKKSRPGMELTVLCRLEDKEKMAETIFKETSTIGLRYFKTDRLIMERKKETVETEFGPVELKVCTWNEIKKRYVEYESAAAVAAQNGVSLDEIYRKALSKET